MCTFSIPYFKIKLLTTVSNSTAEQLIGKQMPKKSSYDETCLLNSSNCILFSVWAIFRLVPGASDFDINWSTSKWIILKQYRVWNALSFRSIFKHFEKSPNSNWFPENSPLGIFPHESTTKITNIESRSLSHNLLRNYLLSIAHCSNFIIPSCTLDRSFKHIKCFAVFSVSLPSIKLKL